VASSVLVFVVEDQELIRHVLEEALTDGGFAVAMATSGEQAMAMLDAEGADYSALVTDVTFPENSRDGTWLNMPAKLMTSYLSST
jgi:DNA-binding NtrC family response regulator